MSLFNEKIRKTFFHYSEKKHAKVWHTSILLLESFSYVLYLVTIFLNFLQFPNNSQE